MPLPSNLGTCIVGGQYVDFQGNAIAGQVKFTPRNATLSSSQDLVIIPRVISVDLDSNGAFTVTLPATDDPDVSPTNFTYQVEEAFSGGRTYDIAIPTGQATINLADVVPAVASTSAEAQLYVLLSVFNTLEARVDGLEAVSSNFNTAAAGAATAATAASTASAAAVSADSSATTALAAIQAASGSAVNPLLFTGTT